MSDHFISHTHNTHLFVSLCLQDELKRVRASQREQQAAAAREAELLTL
jgi:hypothetical protein